MKAIKMFWQVVWKVIENDLFLSCCAYFVIALILSCIALLYFYVHVEVDNWQEEAGV